MNDVVAVGLTTGTVGLVSSFLSYVSARGQSRTTFAIGIQKAQVELAKVKAENSRLKDEYRENERRDRRKAYVDFLSAFRKFHSLSTLSRTSNDEFLAAQDEFSRSHATLLMVADQGVRSCANHLSEGLSEVIAAAYADPDRTGMDAWRHAYEEAENELAEAAVTITEAMHNDVIADLLPMNIEGSADRPAP